MLRQFLAGMILAIFCTSAIAQSDFPSKSIRFVVPYPPGGFTDILARIIGQKLTESLKQAVIVDNKGGRRQHHRHRKRCQGPSRWLHHIDGCA